MSLWLHISALTAKQKDAFYQASGKTVRPEELNYSIISIFAFLLLLWLAWVVLSQYRLWAAEKATLQEAGSSVVRAAIVTMVLILIVNWAKA